VPVGTKPHSVVYNGQHIFVTNFGSNSVSKIEPLTGAVVATIPVGANPAGIAYSEYYGTLWVANSGDNTASVFYGHANSVGATYTVGTNPQRVACENYFVWITSTGDNKVAKRGAWVGGGAVFATIPVGAAPQDVVFDYASIWVANTGANSLSKIAINSSVATSVALPPGALPSRMCFNGSHLIVPCANDVTYRIDVYTDTVTTVNTSLNADRDSPPVFDGVATWVVDNRNGYLNRHLL
jgi:YVTN family beta-propeller protein